MTVLDEKQRIRSAFGAAASAYDSLAVVQRRIADALLERLPAKTACRTLDAGCGTGYLGRQLLQQMPELDLICCDLAAGMLQQAPGQRLCADLEHLPLPRGSLDLYVSSLAWQWAEVARAVAEAARCLRAGGQLLVATLGPASLGELRQAFARADGRPHVRDFLPLETLQGQFAGPEWRHLQIESELFHEHAPDLPQLLHSVRGLGAGVLPRRAPGLYGKNAWLRMTEAYESRRTAAGLPISYEAIFIRATRT